MDTPVAIAGAGPVGLSLALALARQGVRSVVFEQEAELAPHSRALLISLRTIEALTSWNVEDRFFAQGEKLTGLTAYAAETNAPLLHIDFRQLENESNDPAAVIIPQDHTGKILYDALMETGLSEVRFSHRITAVVETAQGVTMNVQPVSGDVYSVNAQYAVGADGAHSMVRQAMGLHLEGMTYPLHVFVADVRVAGERDTLPWPRIALESPLALFAIRFATGEWRLVGALAGDADGGSVVIDKPFVAKRVNELLGPGDFELEWSSNFSIHRRHAPTFRKGRIFIAGDAAHLNSPAGGQGMNSGIQDAHNLAWKLAAAMRDGTDDALLASYDVERRFAVEHGVEKLTDRLTRNGLTTPAHIRRLMLPFAGRVMRIRALAHKAVRAMMMLDTQYKTSPIFAGRSSLLGARSPIPETVLRYTPTLVVYKLEPDVHSGLPSPEDIPGLKILECTNWMKWKCRQPFAALVRPDGVIGYFERNPTATSINDGVRTALGSAAASAG